jgi:hypothetical protein
MELPGNVKRSCAAGSGARLTFMKNNPPSCHRLGRRSSGLEKVNENSEMVITDQTDLLPHRAGVGGLKLLRRALNAADLDQLMHPFDVHIVMISLVPQNSLWPVSIGVAVFHRILPPGLAIL